MTGHRQLHVTKQWQRERTTGQKVADWISNGMGSWPFLIVQSALLSAWVTLNIIAYVGHWDPYPFILMNLVLSMQAAYAAPIILMSQRRQDSINKIRDDKDFEVDKRTYELILRIAEKVGIDDPQ
jgi:uncharacterized membrane protein